MTNLKSPVEHAVRQPTPKVAFIPDLTMPINIQTQHDPCLHSDELPSKLSAKNNFYIKDHDIKYHLSGTNKPRIQHVIQGGSGKQCSRSQHC